MAWHASFRLTFAQMEAAEGRKRLLEGQATSTAQIHESAWQREVLRIYHDAQPQTRAVYQFGHDTADPHTPDNWIIRWMLWHVFRYRDYRNKQQRQMNEPASGDEDDEHSSDLLSPPDSSSSRKGSASSTAASSTQAGKLLLSRTQMQTDPDNSSRTSRPFATILGSRPRPIVWASALCHSLDLALYPSTT